MDKLENGKEPWDEQRRQCQELKYIGLITNGIVHSFNNVIGIIHGYADLALRLSSPNDRNHEYLKQIIEGAESAREIAERIRIFTKQKEPNNQVLQIGPVIERSITRFRGSLPASIEVLQDINAADAAVVADRDQIDLMVTSLLNNAYEATREQGGSIKIALREVDVDASMAGERKSLNTGRYVKLTVSDTGCGMAQDLSMRIFEPFITTKKAGEGAGLGLTVVYAIIKGLKGEILVDSQLGKGTIFDIYLPLAKKGNEKTEG